MYEALYKAWKREKEGVEVQALPKDFFVMLAQYVKKLREESRMLDEKTVKARLLLRESRNVERLARELIQLRYDKVVKKAAVGEVVSIEGLTEEEERLCGDMVPSIESYKALLNDVVGGRFPRAEGMAKPKIMVLRFVSEIPAIVGADMKVYGPFRAEDVASLPLENARLLVRQGVAVEVEVKV